MKKKILFFITNLAHGGAERVLVNLVNNMDFEKFDITVLTIFDTGVNKKYLSDKIKYKSIFPWTFHGIKYITKFLPRRLLHFVFIRDKYDYEIAYLEGPPAKIISGCPHSNTKKLSWIHIELNTNKAFTEGFFNMRDAINSYEKFDKIVCVSKTVKQQFSSISGINKDLLVKYNTNETLKIKKLAKELVDDINFNQNVPIICSVAKIENSKGYDRLINVHKRLLNDNLNHIIYIIGIGKEREKLETRVKELGIDESFKFIGFRENPYKYMANSDIYVCSSRREGISTAVTEALILGKPVVSTNCSGAYELLGDNNEYGIVVDNNEEGIYRGLKLLLQDKEVLKNYHEKAKERGKYFSTEKTVTEIEKLLLEELNG